MQQRRVTTRRQIIRDAWNRRGWSGRERSMAWLARELGCSRQALYQVLDGQERSRGIEERLSTMFPELPDWPPQAVVVYVDGAVELGEWLSTRR